MTFLAGTPIEQAVWLATVELHAQWRREATDRARGHSTEGNDDE